MFLIAKQDRILRRLQEAGATQPSAATTLAQIDLRDSRVFQRLVRRGVIATIPPGRFYLVPEKTGRFLKQRRRAALIALAVAAVVLVAAWIVTGIRS